VRSVKWPTLKVHVRIRVTKKQKTPVKTMVKEAMEELL
jgi:hypothetical protein